MDENKEAIKLLKSIRVTLDNVSQHTERSSEMRLLVTRHRLMVVNTIVNALVTRIDVFLGEDKDADYHH